MSQDRQLAHWQQEILIESLLVQDAPHLALRALRAPGPPIAPLLEIRTLLANNLVAEAFQLQRSKDDDSLLREFFKTCHAQHKWHYVLDLSLNKAEEESLGTFLRTTDSTLTSHLHFVYLLQRSKYIEAISYINDLHNNRRRRKPDLDTPNTIVAAYKLTMTPATRTMSDVYYSLRDNIDTKLNQKAINPNPLSTKLLQRKLDLVGGIYHRTVLSAEQTTPAYWFGQPNKRCNLTPNNVPFLRNPQYDVQELEHKQHLHHNTGLSYATAYAGSNKRHLNESVLDTQERRALEEDEGPRKRRKIISDEESFPIAKATRTIETTLSTPMVLTTEKTPPKSTLHFTAVTPQSILKIPGSPARSIRMRSLSPISADTDDRSIRFNLPFNQDDFRAATPVATSTIRLSPRSALNFSVDNDVTTDKFSSTVSDDDLQQEEKEVEADKISTQETSLQRHISTPKARKLIHDGCGKGDIPVATESFTRASRSLRSRSKTPDVEIAPTCNAIKQTLPTLQRKPLSRIVLEANAKKIIESSDSLEAIDAMKPTNDANTTIDSKDTTAEGRFLNDNSELSETFMDDWNAERQEADSSVNEGASLVDKEGMIADSDASFDSDDAGGSQKSYQPETVIVADAEDDDRGSISVNVSENSDSESGEKRRTCSPQQEITPPDNVGDKNLLKYSTQESPLQRRLAVSDGPKARKRIHEDCVEAETLVVVDNPSTPVRRSLRSRSKTPDVEISAKSDAKHTTKQSLPTTQRKPLSRIVLEANAKKSIESTDSNPFTQTKPMANVSDMSFNNTTINSVDTTVYGRFLSDNSDLSESFMDRWKAERKMANASFSSSMNDGNSVFELERIFSDSDASFVGYEESEKSQLPGPSGATKSAQPLHTEEVVVIDEVIVAGYEQELVCVADDKSNDDDFDEGSTSVNMSDSEDSEDKRGGDESESTTKDTEGESVSVNVFCLTICLKFFVNTKYALHCF